MVINIWKEEHLDLVQQLPQAVKEAIRENLKILEESYGKERTVEDLGGYIALVDEYDIVTFKDEALKRTIPEYIDEIEGADYISALFLLSSDFAIVVICEKKLREILEQ
ncbi:TPA: hypothetical protein KOT44_002063 [Clostridioides difficile]|nr:hypothetical protein [Clostridioides difficile]